MEELEERDDGAWTRARPRKEVYGVDEQLERDEKSSKMRVSPRSLKILVEMQKQCRKFARKKLGKKKETCSSGEDYAALVSGSETTPS